MARVVFRMTLNRKTGPATLKMTLEVTLRVKTTRHHLGRMNLEGKDDRR